MSEKRKDVIVERKSPPKIEIESLEDDTESLAQTFNLHYRAQQLILECLSSDDEIKEKKKSELNKLVKTNPYLGKFILNLFAKSDEGKTKTKSPDSRKVSQKDEPKAIGEKVAITAELSTEKLMEIFAQDNPSLIHKFFELKKNILNKSIGKNLSFTTTISEELEGLHKINIANFKGNWFFKFTTQAIGFISQFTEKIQGRINDLHIVKESAKGQLGFKLHDKLLKMVGLNTDDEIYASKTYQYHDQVKSETSMLSIFDSIGNHKKLQTIISEGSTQFVSIDDFEKFQKLLCDQYIDSE